MLKNKEKIIAGIILGLVMISLIVVLIIYKDEAFKNKVTLNYPDGCSEIYKDDILITEPCENNNNIGLDIELFNLTG